MMDKIFVFDREENLITILSNKNSKACLYEDDLLTEYLAHGGSTFDFSVPMTHPDSAYIQNEGYVVIKVDDAFLQFRIKQVEDTKDGLQKRVFTENASLEMLNQYVRPSEQIFLNPEETMVYILDGSRWEVGIVEVTEERQWKFNEYQNKIAALNALKTAFNARLRYRVELKGNQIVKRYVDLLKNEPIRTGKRIDYRRDIVGLRRVRKSYELFTAVIPVAQDENGKLLTIKDVEWKKSQGAPVDKPKGQDWVGDEEALQKWGINGQHIFYLYESSTAKNANDLIDEAWDFLQAHKDPQPEYEVDVVFLERLGFERDKIRLGYQIPVFDLTFNPPVLVDSTVVELRRSSTNPQNDKVILGDYKELNYRIPDSIKKLQEKLKIQKEVIDTKTKIIQSVTPPSDTTAIWVDTSQIPNIVKTWEPNLQQWVKATPTEAAEVNSYDQQTIDDKDQSVYQDSTYYADAVSQTAESNAKQHADNAAATAENNAKNYTNSYAEKKIAKGSTAPLNPAVGDLWIDTSVTPNLLKRWTGSAWQKLVPTTAAEIGAVDVNTYNTKVQQLSNDIAAKADATWVNGQLVLKENAITKSNTAPANPTTGQLWLDTSTTPNVLKRWTGSAWVKATPTSAGEVGAYTKTEVDNALNSKVSVTQYNTDMNGVVTRLNSAESRITQNEQEIATKVSNTTYQQDKTDLQNDISALETRMANAETSITQNANQIALKANKTDVYTKTEVNNQLANKADNTTVNALETRISEAEAQLTIQANEIATKVSQTTFTQELSKKENAVTKSNSAPSNPSTDQLWLDTSVTPNVLKRWNGSSWVKATPTTAGEVGAYTKSETDTKLGTKANQSDLNTLTTRVSTAETNITQLSNQITLKANASDVYTKQQVDTSLAGKADVSTVSAIEQRVTQAEAQLTVQADQIASKVSRTEFEGLKIGGRNLIRNSGNFKTLGSWTTNGSGTSITLTQKDGFSVLEGIKSITGENVTNIKNGTEYVFSAEVMFDRDVNLTSNTPLHCHVAISGDAHGGKATLSLISTDTVAKANTWTIISVKFKTKNGVTISHFKPFIYGLADGTKFWVKWWKLEEGNKPTAWTPAPEDVDGAISGLDTRLSTAESSITQLSNQIALKVSQSQYDIDVNNLKSRMSSAESQLTIQAGQIATKVEKNGVISAINQTAEQVKIQASKIALDGYVEAKHIKSLNGLNVNNQFIVDSNGKVKFSTSGTNGSVTIEGDTIKQVLGDENTTFGTFQRAYLTSGKLLVEEIYRDSVTERVNGRTTINQGSIEGINSAGSSFLLTPTSLSISTNNGGYWSRLSIDGGRMVLDATSDIQIKKNIDLTSGVIKMPGNQAVVSGADGLYLYTDYGAGGDSYLKVKDDGAVFIVVDGVVKHTFYAGGTKSGGSIIIDGKNLGMSPIDSPQILLEYIEFDVPLTPEGTKVFIEDRFRKAIENFAVFPNNGQVIEKGYGYFVIAGEGTADVRIIGKRIGYLDHFFEDLDSLLESEEISNEN
jgi:phage minor structural protein